VYDVVHHLLGKPGVFSGVPMHLGHFRSHVNERIKYTNPNAQPFFSEHRWIAFIQSGLAARLAGFPSSTREPCCSLRYIGGDGTPIGIPINNLRSVDPVWKSCSDEKNPVKKWGRLDRCAIGNSHKEGNNKTKNQARVFLREVTACSTSRSSLSDRREMIDDMSQSIPKEIESLLETWLGMDDKDARWDSMRRILRACSCEDSLCGIVTLEMIPNMKEIITISLNVHASQREPDMERWQHLLRALSQQGMGPEISLLLNYSLTKILESFNKNQKTFLAVIALLQYIGMLCILPFF